MWQAMFRRIVRPFLFVLSPQEVCAVGTADIVAAAAALATLNVVLGWSVLPIALDQVPQGILGSPKALGIVLTIQASLLVAMCGFRWLVLTHLAWGLGAISGAAASRRPYWGVVIMSDTVMVLREALLAVILWLGRDQFAAGGDAPRIGLNLFVDSSSALVNVLLNEINVFTLWHGVVFAVGLHASAGVTKWMAVAIPVLTWAAVLSIAMFVAGLRG